MAEYPEDIYTEPADLDVDTLKNLGPLRGMAGIWEGRRGLDVNPKPEGPRKQAYVERIELQPIDPQANGPQLFYGLRYHTHLVKPGEVELPRPGRILAMGAGRRARCIHTLPIPRAPGRDGPRQGPAPRRSNSSSQPRASAKCAAPFLEYAFRTVESASKSASIRRHWSYDEDTRHDGRQPGPPAVPPARGRSPRR